jgi:SNF2 family DNA or RNA helicase
MSVADVQPVLQLLNNGPSSQSILHSVGSPGEDTLGQQLHHNGEQTMQLMPHQIEDAAFLASKQFAGCFSGMGSGKTLTALEAVNLVGLQGDTLSEEGRVLIIAPPIALHMWAEEFNRHCKFRAQVIKTGKVDLDPLAHCHVMSYEIATKRALELRTWQYKIMICDESHALKSTKAKRTKAILGQNGLCSYVAHSWMLTGTPQTRWNDDLFPFIIRAGADKLRRQIGQLTLNKFQLRYCNTRQQKFPGARFPSTIVIGNRNTDELNYMMFKEGMAVRRELSDVWDAMPALTKSRLVVDLDPNAELRQMLRNADKQGDQWVEENRHSDALATMRRLIGVAKVKHSVAEIVDRLDAGYGPLLVGAWHTDVIDALTLQLAGKKYVTHSLDGRTGANKKVWLQEQFNDKKLDVLVGQISAMGVSLNLQRGGNRIIVIEEDWSPSVMDQFYARLHRMGQAKPVHVDTFVSDTKLDKAIARISGTKRAEHVRVLANNGETL